MRVTALLLALPVITASESDKGGWEADPTGGVNCWRDANTGESKDCDTSGGDKGNTPSPGKDSDKTWDKTAQPPAMPPRPSLPPGMSRPKILCLHGGGGDAEGFRMQANSLTKAMPGLDFVFLSAPNNGGVWVPDPPISGGSKGASTQSNWDSDSTALLDDVVQKQGPFHGILGYSQGASFAISYLSHAPAGTFQLAALFCGYLPSTHLGIMARIDARMRPVAYAASLARAPRRDREAARITLWLLGVRVARHKGRAAHHRSMYTHRIACFVRNPGAPLTTPAFVFIGEQDALIVPAMSREAATVFASAQISSSPSTGHDLPQPGDPTFDAAIAFLTRESPSSLTPLPGNGDSTAQDNSDSREPANGERDESGESVSESSAARGPRSERGPPLPLLIAMVTTAMAVRLGGALGDARGGGRRPAGLRHATAARHDAQSLAQSAIRCERATTSGLRAIAE